MTTDANTTPDVTTGTVELDEQAQQWLAAYKAAKARVEQDQELVDRCRQQLEATLGDVEVATINGAPAIRHTVITSTRLDTKKLREQRPDVYDEFTRPQMSRRFTVL